MNGWQLALPLFVAGAGLGLLVVPLINVVLVAVPGQRAGSASGLFSTAQQLGGALGVAVLTSVFFARLDGGHGFAAAFAHAAPYAVVGYLACAGLCFLLPTTAVEGVPGADEVDAAVLVS